MRWVVVRALGLSLLLIALCVAAIGVGRLDHTPSPIQILGFDVCDGEPCFRRIKPGMDWAVLQRTLPEAEFHKDYDVYSSNDKLFGTTHIQIYASLENQLVDWIDMSSHSGEVLWLPFSAGNIVAQYGPPCLVYQDYRDGRMMLIYPTMGIDIISQDSFQPTEAPVLRLVISKTMQDFYGSCNVPPDEEYGQWYGFTSQEVYHRRNLAAIGKPYPPGDGS